MKWDKAKKIKEKFKECEKGKKLMADDLGECDYTPQCKSNG